MSAAETDLARRSTVTQLVAAFREAENVVRVSFATIVAAEERLNHAFTLGGHNSIRIDAARGSYHSDFSDPDDCVARMTRTAWRVIVERLELRRVMSIKRWTELDRELDKGTLPAITEENVYTFAKQYADSFGAMMRESVVEVFEWLRPGRHSAAAKYKTNSQLEIPKKVILPYIVERADKRWRFDRFKVNYNRQQELTAMERVFSMLDGQGEILDTYKSALEMAINESFPNDGKGETTYFRFRVFENGNMHIEFKRLDLLKQFNQIAGGGRLRPSDASSAGEANLAVSL